MVLGDQTVLVRQNSRDGLVFSLAKFLKDSARVLYILSVPDQFHSFPNFHFLLGLGFYWVNWFKDFIQELLFAFLLATGVIVE